MPPTQVVERITTAERLSPERSPDQAVALNQQMLALDPQNAAASVRLARAYQAQRQFAAAEAACQEALRRNPQSAVAQKRLQRINEEWVLAKQAQQITTFHDALRQGVEQKDQEQAGYAIACLWRAVELSTAFEEHWIRNRT